MDKVAEGETICQNGEDRKGGEGGELSRTLEGRFSRRGGVTPGNLGQNTRMPWQLQEDVNKGKTSLAIITKLVN